MIIASATPVPIFLSIPFLCSVLLLIVADSVKKLHELKLVNRIAATMVFITTTGLLISEIPYSITPRFNTGDKPVYILGDSLTAGLGETTVTPYPELINRMEHFTIVDLSVPGSKIKNGLQMAKSIEGSGQNVIIELGGNDWRISGKHNAIEYEAGFEKLMDYLSSRQHSVIMMEMPFPPLEYRLAFAQRKIIKRYGIKVIPKRFLSGILFLHEGATSDGIHLTQKGHEIFADRLSKIMVSERPFQ